MDNIDKIKELIRDLERECNQMSGGMNLEVARRMLVVSECITASIQGYLFSFLAGHPKKKPAVSFPPFYR